MKIALVHDYLVQYGGAERVLETLMELYPGADIYTSVINWQRLPEFFINKLKKRRIYVSFLNKIWLAKIRHDLFSFLMPYAFESFDFSKYNFVISDSASFAKGIITSPKTLHICYIHSPTRYLWIEPKNYIKLSNYSRLVEFLSLFFFRKLRVWDYLAARRPDYILTNSNFVKSRIKKFYKRDSRVIYPPCDIKSFYKIKRKPKNYYLVNSRLIQYKRVDLIIKAAKLLNIKLKILGDGPLRKMLEKISPSSIQFLGNKFSDQTLSKFLSRSKAFLAPQEEDFGISMVEAIASGVPVIAYKSGGAREIIKEGINGLFFYPQNKRGLAEAIKKFEKMKFNPKIVRKTAKKFSQEKFKKEISLFVIKALNKWRLANL